MVKIILTIEEDSEGDLNAIIETHNIELLPALEIIKDAQEELYVDRIKLN
jgi:hypothetical protein